ncbi:carboxylesterase 3 [Durotheca rogersii]|uniref:carboxylesterase 3 n=1 Tax=Durotheca rogersii TaxID=419775 RepID=UPI00221FFBAB|nr:carboxylesterase 3 [Durotheca rogersii]KAI5863353.1 carboxylesterase 3 [Durotheca rogersii]
MPQKTLPLELNQGTYLGEIQSQNNSPRPVEVYRGIPYAQSTTGQNRFRAPQPLNSIKFNLNRALAFGHVCPQNGGGSNQGEDCLNLNIYRPHFGDTAESAAAEMTRLGVYGKKLPIVIYVHGGGFNSGSGAERNMASFVAWAEAPIIGISFNYRVGALGFLPSGLTAEEGALNLGLKDQQFLFRWVQKNAEDIGGDPNNITLMGLSAGAHSIGHHLISYSPANKLTSDPVPFQKAILESGGSTARATFAATHPLHEQQFQEFLTGCGLEKTSSGELFAQLRALPLSTIVAASNSVWGRWTSTLRWPFQPVIDGPGGVIPDLPLRSWEKGNALRIPILTGFNTNEGATFVPTRESNTTALRNLMSSIVPALNSTDLEFLNTLYPDPSSSLGQRLYITNPPAGFGTQFWRLDDAYAHYAYICPVLQTSHLASTAQRAGPVYTYQYAARSNARGAADHGDEAIVVAHDMGAVGRFPGIVEIADAMIGSWTRFAVTGDPNPVSGGNDTTDVVWPKFASPFVSDSTAGTNDTGHILLFGQGNDERMGTRGRQNKGVVAQTSRLSDRETEQCRFWFSKVPLSEGLGNGTTIIATNQTTKARL